MRTSLLCAAALALSLVVLGCGGGGNGTTTPDTGIPSTPGTPGSGGSGGNGGGGSTGGGAADTRPPVISGGRVSPTAFDFRGGVVTITADVTDASPILQVMATIQRLGGNPVTVTLNHASGATWQGTYTVPANQSTTGQRQVYSVSVRALDSAGNTSQLYAIGTVSVSATEDPLPPPPSWPDF